jgi:hypothetical protein
MKVLNSNKPEWIATVDEIGISGYPLSFEILCAFCLETFHLHMPLVYNPDPRPKCAHCDEKNIVGIRVLA